MQPSTPSGSSPARKSTEAKPATEIRLTEPASAPAEGRDEAVRSRAYRLSEACGCEDGSASEDRPQSGQEVRPWAPLTRILAVSPDPDLLASRCSILRSAGHVVEQATSIDEAIERLQAGAFDLVLLCHSIAIEERNRLTCLIRASGSLVPVVYLTAEDGHVAGRVPDTLADATVEGTPEELLRGTRQVLRRAGKDRGRSEMPSPTQVHERRAVERERQFHRPGY